MSQPVLAILSGSNGAGKSTLTAYAREESRSAAVLDPDEISRSARDVSLESASDIASGQRVLALAEVVGSVGSIVWNEPFPSWAEGFRASLS